MNSTSQSLEENTTNVITINDTTELASQKSILEEIQKQLALLPTIMERISNFESTLLTIKKKQAEIEEKVNKHSNAKNTPALSSKELTQKVLRSEALVNHIKGIATTAITPLRNDITQARTDSENNIDRAATKFQNAVDHLDLTLDDSLEKVEKNINQLKDEMIQKIQNVNTTLNDQKKSNDSFTVSVQSVSVKLDMVDKENTNKISETLNQTTSQLYANQQLLNEKIGQLGSL
ncbi:hypothetical protein EIN_117880 [Entamoeba invadens IP1]|uniref:Uncharacterized protein n=1 Tax=Entamoeba invadens IP1 TaxID=370355 RepID=L7FNG5_ENTIV|nr:hypothetical protein EIN_117880 [Entamoeba invadens IP1]ELP92214.1 hypothetical protein EIN_117880 [Entamoeba invadens IP1]|eukprot:XP_004258985.1 hypothetical protein EIN_117880 [Entamoeba invadens IP1]